MARTRKRARQTRRGPQPTSHRRAVASSRMRQRQVNPNPVEIQETNRGQRRLRLPAVRHRVHQVRKARRNRADQTVAARANPGRVKKANLHRARAASRRAEAGRNQNKTARSRAARLAVSLSPVTSLRRLTRANRNQEAKGKRAAIEAAAAKPARAKDQTSPAATDRAAAVPATKVRALQNRAVRANSRRMPAMHSRPTAPQESPASTKVPERILDPAPAATGEPASKAIPIRTPRHLPRRRQPTMAA